jgi:hypothetical protein
MAKLPFHEIEMGLLLWLKRIRLHGEEFRLQSDVLLPATRSVVAFLMRYRRVGTPARAPPTKKRSRYGTVSDALHSYSFILSDGHMNNQRTHACKCDYHLSYCPCHGHGPANLATVAIAANLRWTESRIPISPDIIPRSNVVHID